MTRKLRVHFLVPADKAPAPHMTSGPPKETPVGVLGTGKPHVCACDPTIKMSEWDNGTDLPYAVACAACVLTDVWKESAKNNPHPRLAGRPAEAEDVSAAMRAAGCCD